MKLHIHETMSHLREHCATAVEQGSTIRQRGRAYDEVTARGAEIRHIIVPEHTWESQRLRGIDFEEILGCLVLCDEHVQEQLMLQVRA